MAAEGVMGRPMKGNIGASEGIWEAGSSLGSCEEKRGAREGELGGIGGGAGEDGACVGKTREVGGDQRRAEGAGGREGTW
jgi:hypothetical protein